VRLRITLEGVSYDVDVEVLPDDLKQPEAPAEAQAEADVQEPLPPPPPDFGPEDRICRSPISGAVVSVSVAPGDRVRRDDPVAVIEAMKMQISIGAPMDGTVDEVQVKARDAVSPGQILCTIR
jgi:biotin carboxyl carrier protein